MSSNLPPEPIYVLRGSNAPISSIKFLKSSESDTISQLAAGNQDGQVMIWDLKIKGVVNQWKAHSSSVLWLHPMPQNLIWTEGRNESVILWDMGNSTPVKLYVISIHEYFGFSPCSLSKDNNCIAVPGVSSVEVRVFNIKKRSLIHRLQPHDIERGLVMAMQWLNEASNENLIVVYESGHVSLWNINGLSIVSEILIENTPICFRFCETLNIGLCGTSSSEVALIHVSKKCLTRGKNITIKNEGISSCSFRPDGKIYATGGWDYRVRLFSGKSHKPLAVLKYHKDTVECVEFSNYPLISMQSEFVLACGSADHSISLWQLFNT